MSSIEEKVSQPTRESITPLLARQDYYNEIQSLMVCLDPVNGPVSHELFYEQLRKWFDNGKGYIMRSFSEKFSPEKYPGIIAGTPPSTVARFDGIALEINNLYNSGKLTKDKIIETEKEMKELCYAK